MKLRFTALTTLVGLLTLMLVAPVAAQPPTQNNGAAGVVAAVVGLNNTLTGGQVGLVNIDRSLNNLTALNNVLNNSPILSNNNVLNGSPILNDSANNLVTIQDILNNSLNGIQILNDNNIEIGQVLGVAVLSGGGIAVFV